MGLLTAFLASKFGVLKPANGLNLESANLTANVTLADVGADTLVPQLTDTTNGWYTFELADGCGLDIRVYGTGAAGATWTGRLWSSNRLERVPMRVNPQHWHRSPLCDVAGTLSSNAVGVAGGLLPASYRWGTGIVITNDGGLAPSGTRTMQHTTATQPAGRIIMDPVCAQYVHLQLVRGTATGLAAVAFPWQRS